MLWKCDFQFHSWYWDAQHFGHARNNVPPCIIVHPMPVGVACVLFYLVVMMCVLWFLSLVS